MLTVWAKFSNAVLFTVTSLTMFGCRDTLTEYNTYEIMLQDRGRPWEAQTLHRKAPEICEAKGSLVATMILLVVRRLEM